MTTGSVVNRIVARMRPGFCRQHRRARLCIVLVSALAAANPFPPAQAAAPAPVVSPSAWMDGLARQALVPGYASLQMQAEALAGTLERLCEGDLASAEETKRLESARATWRDTAAALRRVTPLPFGPALESRVLRQIDFWPTRPPQILATIRDRAAGTLDDARIGVTARGLPALEFLLFDPQRVALNRDPAACAYATWVARDVVRALVPMAAAWQDWRNALAQADATLEARLLGDGVNILVGATDTLRQKYLEKPARASGAPAFDAWRSGATWAHLHAYFQGLRAGLQGRGDAPGLNALLRGRGLLELAARLDVAVEAAGRALIAVPTQPMEDGGGRVADAVAALLALQQLLAGEVAERLKISIGFGDNDGD